MAVHFSPIGNGFQFLGTNGLPLVGGLLYTYDTGTATPRATYTRVGAGTPNANPIVLATDGRIATEVWLTEAIAYRFQLYTALGTLIATYDDIYGINDLVIASSGFGSALNTYWAGVRYAGITYSG